MVPKQPLMDIDRDCKELHSVKAELDIDYGTILAKTNVIGSECIAKPEEPVYALDEQTMLNDPQDVEVDIITYKNINELRTAEGEDPDATEYSSSFANTLSGTEKYSGLSENEVESQFFDDSDLASPYDTFNSIFQTRKKKLTNHWRSFIRPLMWRCKWTELKLKEIGSQASKYSREIAANEQRKHLQSSQSTLEGFNSKSLPFSNQCYRRRAVKRRKRKRTEEKTDTTSYMLQHSLFSYLESKRCNPDGSSMIDDFENTVVAEEHGDCNDKFCIDSDQLSFELNVNNNSMEQVLREIEIAQSRLHKLKNRLDLVISENAAKFSSYENLSLLAPETSSDPSPTFSAGNAETISVGAIHNATDHISEFDIDDMMIPDSAISSYGEAIHVPDIIESTVGVLSAADVTLHQPQSGDSCENIVENVVIHNEAAEGDGKTSVGTSNQVSEKNDEAEKGEEGEIGDRCVVATSESDTMGKSIEAKGQTVLKSCLESALQFPRNKRKRGERKAGSVGWNKKSSGEPDSQ
ncbi:uncharacterized protein [Euphorbia lathyris]|uniref:uncharacterized protein n=1 Tax=Euphorbia lathyris TaxID=212925 RepID=UPI0033131C62